MRRELRALKENHTWNLTPLPAGRKPIKMKWVFKIKKQDGIPYQLKSRLVACGYSQVKGLDYVSTYSAVGSKVALRTLVSLTAKHGWEWHQCDINNAYLKATLEEDIYMNQPQGFHDGSQNVCKLQKTLYGLKQSAQEWYKTISNYMVNLGYRISTVEPCVFLSNDPELPRAIYLYVDDMLLISKKGTELKRLLKLLDEKFGVKDLGEPEFLLGIKVTRNKDGIHLSQEAYVEELLEKFDNDSKAITSSPMNSQVMDCGEILEKDDAETYHALVGSLLWLSVCTRPDISYSASILGSHMSRPQRSHLEAAVYTLRYLRGTKSEGLFYRGNGPVTLSVYSDKHQRGNKKVSFEVEDEQDNHSDADYAACRNTRRSRTGVYVSLDKESSPVAWISKLQQETSLSSCESELYAAVESYKEVCFVRNLTREILRSIPSADDEAHSEPITVQMDNEATRKILEGGAISRLKHVDVRRFFLRSKVQAGEVKLKYVESKSNKADIFTKPFSGIEMKRLRTLIGMCPKEDVESWSQVRSRS